MMKLSLKMQEGIVCHGNVCHNNTLEEGEIRFQVTEDNIYPKYRKQMEKTRSLQYHMPIVLVISLKLRSFM